MAWNHDRRRVVIAALTLLSVVAAMVVPLPLAAAAPQKREVTIHARAFAYDPPTLQFQLGDTVTINLESMDAAHGLFVDGYNVNIQAEPGKSAHVTFVADRQGKFKIRCSVTCGALHPFMLGEMVVEPDLPFARAMAGALIAAVGALAFFWRGAL
jgi:heme/copper-type cytochrome/quinol oxidase subunit 2